MVMRSDPFSDHLDALVQISRYATDARVVDALLHAALRVARAADEAGAAADREAATDAAARIVRRAVSSDALDDEERGRVSAVLDESDGCPGRIAVGVASATRRRTTG